MKNRRLLLATILRKSLWAICLWGGLGSLWGQQTVGLFQNDSLAYNGYTLFAPSTSRTTYLIDNCGLVVHSWTSNYQPGSSCYLLPGGDLLRTARIPGQFSGGGLGGRIERFSWDGELEWGYNYLSDNDHQHHDIEPLPNGNILVIAWDAYSAEEALAAGRAPNLIPIGGVWSEKIVELEPVGTDSANVIWEWRLWDHLVQDFDSSKANFGAVAEHPERLDVNYLGLQGEADWIHLNSIDYHPELDQILLSSRHLDEIYVIDHSTTTVEAAGSVGGNAGRGGDFLYRWGNPQVYQRGSALDQSFFGQHDAQWIPEGYQDAGKIMVFNNGFGRPGGNYSSVDVISPPLSENSTYTLAEEEPFLPSALDWTYIADPPISFYSSRVSGASRLPNGNTLICEGASGHFFEITSGGDVVWDYINPVAGFFPVSQGTPISSNGVFRVQRFAADSPELAGLELIGTDPVELDPLPSDCQLYEVTTTRSELIWDPGLIAYPNPVTSQLFVEYSDAELIDLEVWNSQGQLLEYHQKISQNQLLNVDHWPKGFYYLRVLNPRKNAIRILTIGKL